MGTRRTEFTSQEMALIWTLTEISHGRVARTDQDFVDALVRVADDYTRRRKLLQEGTGSRRHRARVGMREDGSGWLETPEFDMQPPTPPRPTPPLGAVTWLPRKKR